MNHLNVKLTDYEVSALSSHFNFADGHARYSTYEGNTRILSELSSFLEKELDQTKVENEFRCIFFTQANQTKPLDLQRILYCPSASLSIEIVANFLRLNNFSVALVEPVFDNLADIIKRHQIPLEPLREERLSEQNVQAWLREIKSEAIFLVMPNNPTGYVFSESDFHYLIDFCAKEHKLLILDFSFRFFSPNMLHWDQYSVLEKSGIQYITIEDTGKTWPTFEIKVSPIIASGGVFPHLLAIYRDLFICHSPLAIALVGKFVEIGQSFEKGIWNIVKTNRDILRSTISNTPLKPTTFPNVSVEWICIENEISDLEMVSRLQAYGIQVLPGRYFFWSDKGSNSNFIRFSLMRDIEIFANAMRHLKVILPSILK